MKNNFKPILSALFIGAVLSITPTAFAQDKPVKETTSKAPNGDKSVPAEKPSDALDDLFKRAEDEIKNGEHCGPKPEDNQTPIS